MRISNHRLDVAEWIPTNNLSGNFEEGYPDTIVLHYTEGGSAKGVAQWLCKKEAGASAHVVVGREGEIYQMAEFNRIAWHAGRSEYKGRKNLNGYSIGIEIDNWGPIKKLGNNYKTTANTSIDASEVMKAKHRNERREKYWHKYTDVQIDAVIELCATLMDKYSIKTIVGHEEIAPGRKTDPGPAFPLEEVRNQLFGVNAREGVESMVVNPAEAVSAAVNKAEGIVSAPALNVRSGPGGSYPMVMEPLVQGRSVEIVEESEGWYRVRVVEEGWVSKRYIVT